VAIIDYCGFLSITHLTLSYLTVVCKHVVSRVLLWALWAFDTSGLTENNIEGLPHNLRKFKDSTTRNQISVVSLSYQEGRKPVSRQIIKQKSVRLISLPLTSLNLPRLQVYHEIGVL